MPVGGSLTVPILISGTIVPVPNQRREVEPFAAAEAVLPTVAQRTRFETCRLSVMAGGWDLNPQPLCPHGLRAGAETPAAVALPG